MECSLSSPLRAPSVSVVFPSNSSRRSSSLHFQQLVGFHPSRCQKMFVPGFGEASPEAKAAANLHHFFTFVAINIVIAQLQSYNREAYEELMEFVSHNSLNDGDQFCWRLMRESPRHKGLALRIMEVRSAYSKRDFEWDNLQKLAYKENSSRENHKSLHLELICSSNVFLWRAREKALRIMEVRSAYSKRDFEWDNLQKLAYKMVDESNTRLMRDYVSETSHIEDK